MSPRGAPAGMCDASALESLATRPADQEKHHTAGKTRGRARSVSDRRQRSLADEQRVEGNPKQRRCGQGTAPADTTDRGRHARSRSSEQPRTSARVSREAIVRAVWASDTPQRFTRRHARRARAAAPSPRRHVAPAASTASGELHIPQHLLALRILGSTNASSRPHGEGWHVAAPVVHAPRRPSVPPRRRGSRVEGVVDERRGIAYAGPTIGNVSMGAT